MRIRLTDERKRDLVESLVAFHGERFDDELSTYRAERTVDFFLRTLGPTVYNQAIQDARGFMTDKLEDLDVEFYEPEERAEA